ncbi:MAG TPA: winged helix-turn-helix transcriptional regulator [Thermoplasmata archaeon]|nr:winged helix-turn-helix transcriptional regulator [Thermoplasmata archaeon]
MDEIDLRIYRFLSGDGLVRFWGSRRVLDPRVSAREIAERVGLSEAGVRARLKALKDRGYLRGREVWLNPSLFGGSLAYVEIPIHGPEEAARLFDELALVDAVTFARDLLDEEDRKLRAYFVTESEASSARRVALLRRLAAGAPIRGPSAYWVPPCDRALTSLDWKLLGALRARPDATLAGVARAAGLGLKTTARRFRQLLDSRACWWTANSASEELPLALLSIGIADAPSRAPVAAAIARAEASWMPVAPDGLGVPPGSPAPLAGLLPAEAPASLERSVRRVLGLPGVTGVRRTFALGSRSYPGWFDERLSGRAARSG